ncbi:MAG: hypothetical protein ABIP48_19865 [Planctomycetota bacterium]
MLLVPSVMFTVALAGCPGPGATPQGTFETYREAVVTKDWNTALGCLTPESQDKVVASLVVGLATASVMNQEAADVLGKHGVDRGELMGSLVGGALSNLLSPRDALGEGVKRSVETIADRPAFVDDAMRWLETNSPKLADKLFLAGGAQVSDVEINGDTATGKLSVPLPGGETSIRFKKINGRWLIDF